MFEKCFAVRHSEARVSADEAIKGTFDVFFSTLLATMSRIQPRMHADRILSQVLNPARRRIIQSGSKRDISKPK